MVHWDIRLEYKERFQKLHMFVVYLEMIKLLLCYILIDLLIRICVLKLLLILILPNPLHKEHNYNGKLYLDQELVIVVVMLGAKKNKPKINDIMTYT
eukprot:UN10156